MTPLLLVTGLIVLVAGGELLVRGAVRMAFVFRISPLIIGLTVVAFGTSSPELAVSIFAAFRGSPDLAVGNVVGSNIFNVLFVLGISALLVPLVVSRRLVRLDVPVMIAVSLLFFGFAWNGIITRAEALVLVACLVSYIALQIGISRREPAFIPDTPPPTGHWTRDVVHILLGLALLTIGSRWFVQAAITLARDLGVTELIIGLTVVALGTSLPEVATSIVAGLRGQRDIAVGNVIGSNIFNILAVLGFTGVISVGGVPVSSAAVAIDIPVMLAVAALCLPVFFSGYIITRWEGALFLGYFSLYMTYLILGASNYHGLPHYRRLVLTVVLPLTLLAHAVLTVRRWYITRRPA